MTTRSLQRVPIDDVRAAQERIADVTLRAPLVRLNLDDSESGGNEVYLKLENLQPSGAFKLRGAVNAIRLADEAQLERGVWTASSGNMALAVAWAARYFGLKCVCVVADVSPDAKLDAIRDLGADVVKVPWLEVLEICRVHRRDGMEGLFLHPFSDPKVMAGNATVGLEIVEDLPDVDAVLVPYGGGGFAVSVASAVKALRPRARVYAAEVEAGPAFSASLAAGKPTEIEHPTSFVSGIGSPDGLRGRVAPRQGDTGRLRRVYPGGDGERGQTRRAEGPGGGRGRWSVLGGRGPFGWCRRRKDRLRLVGRQHRRLQARRNPARRRPGSLAEPVPAPIRHEPVSPSDANAARRRILGRVVRTPLVRLNASPAPAEILLKLENLQPVGSFKLRGVTNAVLQVPKAELADGVWTVSAGNTAQALAWTARELGVPMTAVVPENAPETKLANIERLGGSYLKAPFEDFARVFATRSYPGATGRFIHPFSDPAVMAGNATIGLEILEDLPEVDAVVAAYGGGGLCCGIASAIKSARPNAKVYAAEAATSAPLAAALDAGEPTRIDYSLSFVDAIGSPVVQPEMFSWPGRCWTALS